MERERSPGVAERIASMYAAIDADNAAAGRAVVPEPITRPVPLRKPVPKFRQERQAISPKVATEIFLSGDQSLIPDLSSVDPEQSQRKAADILPKIDISTE